MLALSIRQPYAELILQGLKTIEYRSARTHKIGQRFYIYAAKRPGNPAGFDLLGCSKDDLPTGVIVGSARILNCTKGKRFWEWHLCDVKRLKRKRKPVGQPQPIWFDPFP